MNTSFREEMESRYDRAGARLTPSPDADPFSVSPGEATQRRGILSQFRQPWIRSVGISRHDFGRL
jgi:hypothetical protein